MWIEKEMDTFWACNGYTFESVCIGLDGDVGVRYDGKRLSIVDDTENGKGHECWLQVKPWQLAQIARDLRAILQEQFCSACDGLGEVEGWYDAEKDELYVVQCADCGGTGMPKERGLCLVHESVNETTGSSQASRSR